ncbi:MAG: hypothetical protein GAK32_00620 [Pseudomonas fluorescens]|nr:MAG: hypothetical protein GAK32_00620 [Pseudomonas fluorescens]
MKKTSAWSLALFACFGLSGMAPAWGAPAPALSEVRVFKVESAGCSEDIPERAESTRRCVHRGPTQVSVMEVDLGNNPMGRFNGAELNGQRTAVCQVGSLSEVCSGTGTVVGYIYVFDLNVQDQGWFEYSNTSINVPRNTLTTQLNIR